MKVGKKTALLIVLGVVGLSVAYQVGYWAIWTPWQQRFAREEEYARRIRLASASLNRVPALKAEWQSLGERTYGASRGQMIDRMNVHLQGIMDGSASGVRELKLTGNGSTPMVEIRPPTAARNGSAEVQAVLIGVGKIEACFRVLYELANSPYLARVEMARVEKMPNGFFKLYVECIAKLLEQPTLKGMKNGKLADVKFDFKPAEQNRVKVEPFASSKVARELGEKTMFTMWTPPKPPPVAEVTTRRVPETQREVVKPPEPPPPPPQPRDHPERWVVTAIYPPTGDQPACAHLLDEGTKKAWKVRVGDTLWDGTVTEINMDGYLVMRTRSGEYVVEARERKKVADRVRRQDYQATPAILSN